MASASTFTFPISEQWRHALLADAPFRHGDLIWSSVALAFVYSVSVDA